MCHSGAAIEGKPATAPPERASPARPFRIVATEAVERSCSVRAGDAVAARKHKGKLGRGSTEIRNVPTSVVAPAIVKATPHWVSLNCVMVPDLRLPPNEWEPTAVELDGGVGEAE
jgi:hypothetical protein